jgi:MFS family permease
VLLVASGLFSAATSAVRPMVSYRALALGANPFELGVVASAYAALALLIAIPAGRWMDRYGTGRFLLLGGLASAGAAAAMTVSDSLALLAIDHALLGFGQAMIVVALQTQIANASEPADRNRRFGYFAAAFAMGTSVGPLSGGLIAGGGTGITDVSGVQTSLVFAVAVTPLLLGPTMLAVTSSRGSDRRWPSWSGLGLAGLRRVTSQRPSLGLGPLVALLGLPGIRQALTTGVVVSVSTELLTAYLPAFGVEHGLSVTQVSLLLSIRAAFTLLSRVTLDRQVRISGELRTLASSMLLAAGGFALLLTGRWEPAVVALAAIGFGLGACAPMTMTMIVAAAPLEWRGLGLGLRMTSMRLGELVIPWAVGLVAAATGVGVVFVILLTALGGSGVSVWRQPSSVGEAPPEASRAERTVQDGGSG